MTPARRRELERRRRKLDESRIALLATVRKPGDTDSRARRRLKATLRVALDNMRDESAELSAQLEGADPETPYAR